MNLTQFVRDALWTQATLVSLPAFVLGLALSALSAGTLALVYVRFGRSLSNRRLIAHNFLLVAVTTTLIITIVKSSLALSLGLVGALSIVRFRAAIKEPEELAFLFLAISAGLGFGAGQALLTVIALVIIVGLIAIRGAFRRSIEQPALFFTVSAPGDAGLTAGRVLEVLGAAGVSGGLKRLDESAEVFDAAFLVDFRSVASLERATRGLREACPAVRVSCLDDRGLGG